MTDWIPSVGKPLTRPEKEGILEDAVRVLETVGMECAHDETAARLADAMNGSRRNDRVHFPPGYVRDHVEQRRAAGGGVSDRGEAGFSLNAGWTGLNYCDPVTGEVRPGTTEEAVRMARMWDARGYDWCLPLMPGDVAPALVTLASERIALSHSRKLASMLTVTDPEEVRFMRDMNLAAGKRYRFMDQVGISPLRFNAEGLRAAFEFLDDPDVKVILSGSIPMAGATCPLDPRSAVVQSLAETLAQDILCQVLGTAGGGLLRVEPFDLQYSTIVFASPEWCLYWALTSQMREFLTGLPHRRGILHSNSKRPDAQAMCERTASGLWQALLGVRRFAGAGQLAIDEVFSPQQAVLDREIVDYVARLARGLAFDGNPRDAVGLIREGMSEGSFLGVSDTVERFRDFYRFPDIFKHWNVGRWRAAGEPDILAEAWARAEEEILRSDFRLPDDQQREIDAIYGKAREYLLAKSVA